MEVKVLVFQKVWTKHGVKTPKITIYLSHSVQWSSAHQIPIVLDGLGAKTSTLHTYTISVGVKWLKGKREYYRGGKRESSEKESLRGRLILIIGFVYKKKKKG